MNQASIVGLRAGIEAAKKDWAADPSNTGIPMVAIQLPVLEELLDDLAAANEVNVRAIEAREKADERAKALMTGAVRKGKRKK